jgi:hypothetical protein
LPTAGCASAAFVYIAAATLIGRCDGKREASRKILPRSPITNSKTTYP